MEEKLLKKIEVMRKKLNKSACKQELVDSEVVEISQQLDVLLNRYYKLRAYQQLSFW